MEELREIYEAFCAFGSNRNLSSTGSLENIAGPQMDGAKFAKFARDNKIIDGKKVTTTDVDITFNKVKPKGARKLDWNTFLDALTQLAEKKYAGKKGREALEAVTGDIVKRGSGPIASGTTPQSDAIVDRLTDTSKYTGTHKLRFDEQGHGRGLAGRDQPAKTDDLSKLVNREPTTVRGLPVSVDPDAQEQSKPSSGSKRGHASVVTASSEKLDVNAHKPKATKPGERTKKAEPKPYTASSKGGSVFDRLTDSSGYTGSHKERFNSDGTGRGISGRDSPSKSGAAGKYRGGDVKDLSQILRS
ncbi:hypothetical protein HDU85_000879 [Gaertneriomyces sp. JEL0708]|nr:hypothetical protein HDU85_000879 [Gaertneriomyces sp. JEL0708]